MNDNIVIIGGGILSKEENINIHIVEKNDVLGGLYNNFDYFEFGKFDCGAHNLLETGIKELDALLINLLSLEKWNITSAVNEQNRTLTGIFYRGELHSSTSCINLREDPNQEKYFQDLKEVNLRESHYTDYNASSVEEYSSSIFGKSITDDIISQVVKNIFGLESSQLNKMAIDLLGISRVCLFDSVEMSKIVDKKIIRRLGYPEQREIPKKILSSRKAYYPKEFGMYRIIDAIVN